MSGGRWEYVQYRFTDVIDDLKSLIEKNGKEKTKKEMQDERWRDSSWYDKYPEDRYHYRYPDEVINEFKKAVDIISMAQVYMHRVDWLLCGDDGDESFIERLKEELNEL